VPQPDLNLSEFMPIPGLPGYLAAKDGRVVSLKKARPTLLEWEIPESCREAFVTVKLSGRRIKVRDLVIVLFGTDAQFFSRLVHILGEVGA
jgi:hypothetical protein